MSRWHPILEAQGLSPSDELLSDFGKPVEESLVADQGDCISPLGNLETIRASGEDLRDFLQGQLSNDIRLVDPDHSQLSSYNSPKGRMLASLRLFQREASMMLQFPSDIAEATLKRLRMFIMRSQVTLEVDDALLTLGLSGPTIADTLASQLSIAIPAATDEVTTKDDITLIRIASGGQPRFLLVAPTTTMANLFQPLIGAGAQLVGTRVWQLLEIRAGLPSITNATRESFVAQMLNFHLINGVNFKKGCYPGQEVVARMHYIGKVKRRMFHARVKSPTPPQPGDALFSPSKEGGQGAGNIVMVAPTASGYYELLAVLDIHTMEMGPVHLENNDGPILEILDLPYRFDEKETA